jgi:hypothetical protein
MCNMYYTPRGLPKRVTAAGSSWLLLQLRLPAGGSTARVGVWRRLRGLGAVGLGATWMLPGGDESRESCEWVRRDVEAAGGEAFLFEARPVGDTAAALARRRAGGRPPAGRGAAVNALAPLDRRKFSARIWVTRHRPGVDRMASAWLIRRFIDPRARFAFAGDAQPPGRNRVPFDTYGAELGHQQGLCTFEVLARRFGIDDPAVHALGRTVRAIDLAEVPPDAAEAAMVDRLVTGLRATHAEDAALLNAGIALFETLYASADDTARGGRPPAKPGSTPATRQTRSRAPARRKPGR